MEIQTPLDIEIVFGLGGRVKGFSGSSIMYPVENVSVTNSVAVDVSI